MGRQRMATTYKRKSSYVRASFDDGYEEANYHGARLKLWRLISTSMFKNFVAVVIILNTVVVVHETNLSAFCDRKPAATECTQTNSFVVVANLLFLAVYAAEMVLRIFVHRLLYFFNPSDLFDGAVVVVGVFAEFFGSALPGVAMLRLFRVFRVLRTMKAVHYFEEAKIFISGIASASKAIIVGSVLVFFTTFLWAMVAVMVIGPVNQQIIEAGVYDASGCERCVVAFESVEQAMLTLLQTVVMADNWGSYAVPIIEHTPWTVVIFVGIQFSVCLGLTNLILAVIMDKALENRDVNLKREAANRLQMMENAREEFVGLCTKLDSDKSGFLTLKELHEGFDLEEFRAVLTMLDINKEDLDTVFRMMDRDGSGEVSYEEFSYQLQNLKSQDIHTMVSFIKFYVLDLHMLHEMYMKQLSPEIDNTSSRLTLAAGQMNRSVSPRGTEAASTSEWPRVDGYVDDSCHKVHKGCQDACVEVTIGELCAPARGTRESATLAEDGLQTLRASLVGQVEELQRRLEYQVTSMRETISRDLELSVKIFRAYLTESRSFVVDLSDRGENISAGGFVGATAQWPAPFADLPSAKFDGGRHAMPVEEEGGRSRGDGVKEPRLATEGPRLLQPPRKECQAL